MEWFFIAPLLVVIVLLIVLVPGPKTTPEETMHAYRRGHGLDRSDRP